jgi:threonyl-tRNA synthetase
VPYSLIVGKKEVEASTVAVRSYFDGDLGPLPVPDVIAKMQEEIAAKVARRKE